MTIRLNTFSEQKIPFNQLPDKQNSTRPQKLPLCSLPNTTSPTGNGRPTPLTKWISLPCLYN